MDSDDDVQIVAEGPSLMPEEEQLKKKPLLRKPLPQPERSSADLSSQLLMAPEPLSMLSPPRGISRKALSPDVQSQVHIKEQVQKKPLGPRPLVSGLPMGKKPLRGIEDRTLGSAAESQDTTRSHDFTRQSEDNRQDSIKHDGMNYSQRFKKSFSITIIRRDPSSGAQWNIGAILGEEQRLLEKSSHSKKPFFEISVYLTTPGYTQFKEPRNNRNTGGLSAIDGNRNSMSGLQHDAIHQGYQGCFSRQIRMEGSSFWNRSKQRRKSQSDGSVDRDDTHKDSYSPNHIIKAIVSDQIHSNDDGSKGYAFSSLWGGRCKFSTSSSGRTLRCKHTLPSPVSGSSTSLSGSSSQVVSELRFNLPSMATLHKYSSPTESVDHIPGSGRFQVSKLGHIRNKLSPDKIIRPSSPTRPRPSSYVSMYPSDEDGNRPPLPPRPCSNPYGAESSDEGVEGFSVAPNGSDPSHYGAQPLNNDQDGPLDLSIGQEKAGGGNRGKRVKLGKLIVFDEGYKMLDLVVAANMGVWWSVWESSN